MCPPKAPKIAKADPVQAAPPPLEAPKAPVINEPSANPSDAVAAAKRKGKQSLLLKLDQQSISRPQIGVNVPT